MLRFKVRGSAGDIYEVTADRHGDAMVMTCTCEAAHKAMHCHHRLELLNGELEALVSGNAGDVAELARMVVGTALEAGLDELHKAEAAVAAAKLECSRRMKAIDRLLLGDVNLAAASPLSSALRKTRARPAA